MTGTLELDQFVVHYERKVKSKCEICASSFKFGRSQHICKRCCRSVCDDCSPFKVKCYMADYKNDLHRMCRKCHIQSEVLKKYVNHNHLKWGQDSDLVKLWLRQLGLKSVPRKRNSQKKKIKQYTSFMQVWKSLNFSFREFIGITIDEVNVSEGQLTELINVGLSELSCNKLVDLKHTIYILVYFLAHCNVHNAVYFTSQILQTISIEQFSMENIHFFLQQMHCSQMEILKMENIIEENYQKTLKRSTVNVFTAQLSIEIMTHLLSKRELQQLDKGIAYVFSQRKQFICQHSNKPNEINIDILRNISSTNYRKIVKEIEGVGSPGSEKSIASGGSDRQETKSNRSIMPAHRVEHIRQENQQLKATVRNQASQIEDLRKQIQCLRLQSPQSSRKDSKDSDRKGQTPNFLQKVGNEIHLFRQSMIYRDTYMEQNDPYSTAEQSNDESNYNEIINKKNQQIVKLKKQLQASNQKVKLLEDASKNSEAEVEVEKKSQSVNSNNTINRRENKQQVQKLKEENQSLKTANKKLFLQIHQLSNLLMDKEQRSLQEANKQFEQLAKEMGSGFSREQLQKQCRIF